MAHDGLAAIRPVSADSAASHRSHDSRTYMSQETIRTGMYHGSHKQSQGVRWRIRAKGGLVHAITQQLWCLHVGRSWTHFFKHIQYVFHLGSQPTSSGAAVFKKGQD
eukprot:1469584-Amphidinium_carterae.1